MNFGLYFVNGRYGKHWMKARRYFGKRLNVYRDWELGVTGMTKVGKIIAPLYVDDYDVRESITALRPYWRRIIALELADEPKWSADETARILRQVNEEIARQGLAPKPSIVVYTRDQILQGTTWKVDGIIPGLECYLDYKGQETDAQARKRMTAMIGSLLTRVGKRKVMLVGQAYDRNGTYKDKESLVAIQQPIFDAARRLQAQGRLIALCPFAYARPGGVTAYPTMKAEIKRQLYA